MTVRIVIADDHALFLDALGSVLNSEKDINILARCANGKEALSAARKHHPDLLLLDYNMPGLNGVEVLRRIKKSSLQVRVVLVADSSEDYHLTEAVRLGVDGIVFKEMRSQLLIQCIRTVHAGERWLEPSPAASVTARLDDRQAIQPDLLSLLSLREIEIGTLVAQGWRNREIAKNLFINEGTVKVHLHNVSEKLNLRGRYALAVYVRDRGLASRSSPNQ